MNKTVDILPQEIAQRSSAKTGERKGTSPLSNIQDSREEEIKFWMIISLVTKWIFKEEEADISNWKSIPGKFMFISKSWTM